MSDRSVITFYYDYEQEHRISGKRRVRGLISRQYGTAYLSELIPHAYNGIKFFLHRCKHWDFSMGRYGSSYDALNEAFDTFFDEKTISNGEDLVRDALKRADQNLYGYVPDEKLMRYMFGWDIFGSIHISYTGSLKNGYVLKYGFADHGYYFKPLSFKSHLEEYDRDSVMKDQAWDTVKPLQVIRDLDKLARQSAHVEKLFSYQGSGGSFDIFVDPEKTGKLCVINGTDAKGKEFERSFNYYDFDLDDMDYLEFCAFLLLKSYRDPDLYELISDDFFVNAEGFDGIFDRGERIDLLGGFIDNYDGENEELIRVAEYCYLRAYDHVKLKEAFDFFDENAQLIRTKKGFFGIESKGCAFISEMIGEPKRRYETLTAGKTGPICDCETESDDDTIDKKYLSVLTYNCLMENNIYTIGEMKTLTFEQLNEMKNIPLRSKVEILEEFYVVYSDGSVGKKRKC